MVSVPQNRSFPIYGLNPIGSHCVPMGLNPYVVSFFVDFAARWAASPFRIKMLGMAKPFLRRGFACGKTLERRKSGAALKGRWARFKTVRPKFEISRLAKKKDMTEVMSFFLGSAARGRLHPSALECSGRRSRPSAEVLPAAKRSNAAKAARPRRAAG